MKISTPYSRAWATYSDSKEFQALVDVSRKDGEGERYTINRLRSAFDAGWNAKTSSILTALNNVAHKDKGGE